MMERNIFQNSSMICGHEISLNAIENKFSHIYVEEEIKNFKVTRKILQNFPNSKLIYINNYRDVFNRVRQNFNVQKYSQKLILAKAKSNFIYDGSDMCEDFGQENFYYSSSILNCIYNCEYCYLKGLYPSSNVVIFVNVEDFIEAAVEKGKGKKIYVCISYDSDILVFENITGFAEKWIRMAEKNPNILIEIRTKSINFKSVKHLDIPSNVIFAWSLLPDEVIQKYEFKVPNLNSRLKSIGEAIEKGVQVRLSIEPIMQINNFDNVYEKFITKIFNSINKEKVRDINIDTFRVKKEHLKRIRKLNPYENIFGYKFSNIDDYYTYEDSKRMKEHVYNLVRKYVPENKIF
ncbi:radical SAM protein [Clostridium felsineum]|uniref:SPL family radical SAM protein n=1 Tax=Clostridium felsineum TaxID=36839 RepID=UPI00098CDF35|nr:radical SAM protein [Clostridium felsineum]MCR3758354.1 radical SAM protein [Clostridium felsineum]URZ03715.1 hypothetical protein CLAUR_037760 [Clostridium felsineum]